MNNFSVQRTTVTVDSRIIFKRALNTLSDAISESNAAVEIGALPRVTIAEPDLLQLFENILGNALKFRGYWPPYIRARSRSDGRFCEFSIEDNGIGIEAQHSEHVFKAHRRPVTGLSTCKQIVEGYGGRIWVESELNEGATFFFTVPSVNSGD